MAARHHRFIIMWPWVRTAPTAVTAVVGDNLIVRDAYHVA